MKLVFLGTSGMVPTKERNVQSLYLDYNGEGILLDCGEGTQRQLTFAGLNAQKIKTILISHWHGDHVSGLVGLLQTIGNFSGVEKTLRLFGPVGTKEHLNALMNSCIFENKLNLEVTELDLPKLRSFYETDEYVLQGINLDHSVPCIGYRFERKERRKMNSKLLKEQSLSGPLVGRLQNGETINYKGKAITPEDVSILEPSWAIAFIFDTQLTQACYDLAENSAVLVSEAVYDHSLEHKAEEFKHMTARQAAHVAANSGVSQLILTHFSQRYKDVSLLEADAKNLFEQVTLAYDLMKIDLPF